MISDRYLVPLAVALALACVPTIIHSYIGMTAPDDRDVRRIPLALAGISGRPTDRRPASVHESYGTTDFIERRYRSMTLFVARSYDAKRLYHHPELAVAHGDSYTPAVVMRRPSRPDVPVFVLDGDNGRHSVYALLYGDEFIESPIRFQLRNALTLIVRPKAPTTLFFVRATLDESDTVERLLLAAVDGFRAQSRTARR